VDVGTANEEQAILYVFQCMASLDPNTI